MPIVGDFICNSFWLTDHEQNILMLCDRSQAGLSHKYHYIKMPFKLPEANDWLLTSLLLEEYYTESNEIDRINTAQALHTLWNSLLPHVAQQNSVLCTMLYLFDNQYLFDSLTNGLFNIENMLSHHRLTDLFFEVPCKQSRRSVLAAMDKHLELHKQNPDSDYSGVPELILSRKDGLLSSCVWVSLAAAAISVWNKSIS